MVIMEVSSLWMSHNYTWLFLQMLVHLFECHLQNGIFLNWRFIGLFSMGGNFIENKVIFEYCYLVWFVWKSWLEKLFGICKLVSWPKDLKFREHQLRVNWFRDYANKPIATANWIEGVSNSVDYLYLADKYLSLRDY